MVVVALFASPALDSRIVSLGSTRTGAAVVYFTPDGPRSAMAACELLSSFTFAVQTRQGSAQPQAPFVSPDFELTAQLVVAASSESEPACPFVTGELTIDLRQTSADFAPAQASDPKS